MTAAREWTLAAHAKVNLVLRVLGLEPNGYHQIETVFQRLALADDVTVAITDGPQSLDVEWEGRAPINLGPADQNIAWRAAATYARATGWPKGWQIALRKRIPAGAGLGGGSSDAAAVLRGLNALAASPLPIPALLKLGAALGADVPFFVTDSSLAIGRGYGERVTPVDPLPPAAVGLFVPPYGIATAGAYAALDRLRAADPPAGADLPAIGPAHLTSWAATAKRQNNDFEPSVFAGHPDLWAIRNAMAGDGAIIARLSGSGSVVFGVWPDANNPPPRPESKPQGDLIITTTA